MDGTRPGIDSRALVPVSKDSGAGSRRAFMRDLTQRFRPSTVRAIGRGQEDAGIYKRIHELRKELAAPSSEAQAATSQGLELTPDEIARVDAAFRNITEGTTNHSLDRQSVVHRELIRIAPEVHTMGSRALPHLVTMLGAPQVEQLSAIAQREYQRMPEAYAEYTDSFIADLIDGLVDPSTVGFAVAGLGRVARSTFEDPAKKITATIKRTTYPLRLARESGQLPPNDTRLEDISNGLVRAYEQNPNNAQNGGFANGALLEAIALTGTDHARRFVLDRMGRAGRHHSLDNFLDNPDRLSWASFTQYDFSPPSTSELSRGLLMRKHLTPEQGEQLLRQVTEVQKLPVRQDAAVNIPVARPNGTEIRTKPAPTAAPEKEGQTLDRRKFLKQAVAAVGAASGAVGVIRNVAEGVEYVQQGARFVQDRAGEVRKRVEDAKDFVDDRLDNPRPQQPYSSSNAAQTPVKTRK